MIATQLTYDANVGDITTRHNSVLSANLGLFFIAIILYESFEISIHVGTRETNLLVKKTPVASPQPPLVYGYIK